MRLSLALGLSLAFGLGLAVAACSSPSSTKTDLVVCEAGENGCPGKTPPKSPREGETNDADNGELTPNKVPDAGNDPGVDAGHDASSGTELGALCTKLETCCDDLEGQGYSRETCQGVVDTRNETACHAQHEQYREFGDCS